MNDRHNVAVITDAHLRQVDTDENSPQITIDMDAEKVRSHIAEGDEFVGDMNCKTGVRISGTVRGSVKCETGAVVLESTGHVTGSIVGQDKIFIDGKVGNEEGDPGTKITSPGLITLMTNAIVNADIEYGKMATYGDMTHNGNSRKIQPTR
jgi:cytoskeletal protein CcmA (bactofilin family)